MNISKAMMLIIKTKNEYEKARKLERQVFDYFLDNNIDLQQYPGGINSNNLEEMISCYFMYNEDSIVKIEKRLKEIKILDNGRNNRGKI